jgi:hypothetical protein
MLISEGRRPSMTLSTLKRMRRAAIVAFAGTLLFAIAPAGAQQNGEIIPGSECSTPGRPLSFLGDILATPASTEPYSTPTAVPDGTPVDDATAAEINAAVRQFIACSNSGEVLRALSLLGDDYLRRVFDPSGDLSGETADKLIESVATPMTIEPDQLVVFLGIREMVALPDGRVAVVIETDGGNPNPEGTDVDLFIFKRIGNAWIVDDAVNDIDDLEDQSTSEAGS